MPLVIFRNPLFSDAGGGEDSITIIPATLVLTPLVLDPDHVDFDDSLPAQNIIRGGELPASLWDAAFGPYGQIYRRVDIYEQNAVDIWYEDAPFLGGEVSVDMDRDERRTLDITFDNPDGILSSDPSRFWYNKVIKVYQGVQDRYTRWETQVGEFLIDEIGEDYFPSVVTVSGRDYSKRFEEPFDVPTAFDVGSTLEDVILGIAVAAGIDPLRVNLPPSGITFDRTFMFDALKPRKDAMKEILEAFGYEWYFTPNGILTIRPWVDPFTATPVFTFLTGATGNLSSYSKRTNDTNVKNRVRVVGKASDRPPVYGLAENSDPASPTHADNIGARTLPFESSFIETEEAAQALAEVLLSIHGLESYEIDMDALVVSWLEAGTAVDFIDPNPVEGAPVRFLLTNFSLPLEIGTMSATGKRITLVSAS